MKSFTDWVREDKFTVRQTWDMEKGEWAASAGPLALFPFQQRILEHCLTPNENGHLPYATIVYGTTKKSGKSALGGAVAAWAAEEFDPGSEIYIVASSQEQAEGRVMRDAKYHIEHSDKWAVRPNNMVTQYKIQYPNDTYIQALAKSYKASAGSRHSLSIFDELWAYTTPLDQRMFAELTPIPTVKNSIQFIATYAGFENESDLLWDLYLKGVGKDEHPDGQGQPIPGLDDLPCWSNGRLFIYWDHENRLPWQDAKYLSQQFDALRPADYLRFHENRWVNSTEEFLPAGWWDRAATPPKNEHDKATKGFPKDALIWNEHPYRTFPMYAALDAATKHDCIAIVGVCYDAKAGDVIQMIHRIWTPNPSEVFDFETTVEPFLLELKKKFNLQVVGYDPKDMHQTSLRLARQGVPMLEYIQSPSNMTEASHALYEVLRANNFRAYPSDEMRDHIRMAVAEDKGRGYTIKKYKARTARPVDAAVALAMAVKLALNSGGVDASTPIRIESAFADRSAWDSDPSQAKLPWQFQEDR